MTWLVVFFGLDLYGWEVWTIHATLTPGGHWEINVKHSWRNPPKSFYKATWETNVKNRELFGERSKERRKQFAAKNPFTMAEDPKANAVGEKVGGTFHRTFFEEKIGRQMYRRVGGTFHITREDYETNAKKSWGNLPQNLFRGRRNFPQETPAEEVAPRPLLWLKTPKQPRGWGEKLPIF